MVSFPPCKINLGLQILDKRPDGYHNLETCFYPVPWNDILEVILADAFSFTSSGDPIPGSQEENLCVRAYKLLAKDFDIDPVKIHLHKIIPSGAGLGGGSSDAAYTLRLLNIIFNLNLSNEKLMTYAAVLGSDCAFFVHDNPMLGTGRGEVLAPIPVQIRDKYVVIAKPDIHVSTADAFAGIRPGRSMQSVASVVSGGIETWRSELKNDFEDSVFRRHPKIALLKDELYSLGALYASMSGSGSAVYGIFSDEVEVKGRFRGCKVWSGDLSG